MIKDFEYLCPKTESEALSLLAKHKEDAKIIAGGQSMLVVMKQGLLSPEYLIDIKGLSSLDYIKHDNANNLLIGALTVHRAIEKDPYIKKNFPVLSEMERNVATTQTRNWGTIGGNICHADPAGDPGPVFIALNATLKLARTGRERIIKAEDFFLGYLEVTLKHGEMLTEIQVPPIPPRTGVAQEKLMVMQGDMGIVGAAVSITLSGKGDTCQDVRIVLSNAGSTPIRPKKAEKMLIGKAITEALLAEASQVAATEVDAPADVHGSTEYRQEMVKVFVKRVALKALARAKAA
jgi:CO/xanthine dehydrogenase FAD-binding subunit